MRGKGGKRSHAGHSGRVTRVGTGGRGGVRVGPWVGEALRVGEWEPTGTGPPERGGAGHAWGWGPSHFGDAARGSAPRAAVRSGWIGAVTGGSPERGGLMCGSVPGAGGSPPGWDPRAARWEPRVALNGRPGAHVGATRVARCPAWLRSTRGGRDPRAGGRATPACRSWTGGSPGGRFPPSGRPAWLRAPRCPYSPLCPWRCCRSADTRGRRRRWRRRRKTLRAPPPPQPPSRTPLPTAPPPPPPTPPPPRGSERTAVVVVTAASPPPTPAGPADVHSSGWRRSPPAPLHEPAGARGDVRGEGGTQRHRGGGV